MQVKMIYKKCFLPFLKRTSKQKLFDSINGKSLPFTNAVTLYNLYMGELAVCEINAISAYYLYLLLFQSLYTLNVNPENCSVHLNNKCHYSHSLRA